MTYEDRWEDVDQEISIHIPRVGDDGSATGHRNLPSGFQSTSPVWGMTAESLKEIDARLFQSTSPVWGMTAADRFNPTPEPISIHIPRVGDDL